MKSYDIVEWGKPLQLQVRETPQPQGSQVLVRIDACGVCHSDLHIQTGALDLGNGRKATFESIGVQLPFTMGHEIIGVVAAVGPESDAVVGSRCVVYPWQGCGRCHACRKGREIDCENGAALGTRRRGGYADHVMVPHTRYLLDYGTLDPLVAATCACSGLTAYSALRKLPDMEPEDSLLLMGAGGLGLAALGLAKGMGCERIVVSDIDDDKLMQAARGGATSTVNVQQSDAGAALRAAAPAGIRAVIDFVGSPETVELALSVVGRGGTVVVVGLFGGALPLSTALLPMRNIELKGSYVGTLEEMRDLLALLQREPLLSVPLTTYPMSQINDALGALATGKVVGRLLAIAGE
ncbi:zinc-binding dehydrogenase [Paraburkholderia terrae]